jgi:hypothetical protein
MSRIVRARQNFVSNNELTKNKWYDVTSYTDEDFTITLDNGRIYTANIKDSLILDHNDWEIQYEFDVYAVITNDISSAYSSGQVKNGVYYVLEDTKSLSHIIGGLDFWIKKDERGSDRRSKHKDVCFKDGNGNYTGEWTYLSKAEYDAIHAEEKILTHVIVPEGACSYLTAGEIIEVKVDNPRSDGTTYFESFNRNTRIMGILNGDGHTNYIPWIPVYNNQLPSPPDVIHTDNNKPIHRWAFISNLTETKSNIKTGKHYDIIEEIDNKVLIEDETGSKIWMGKNYSEYLYGGKPELIK